MYDEWWQAISEIYVWYFYMPRLTFMGKLSTCFGSGGGSRSCYWFHDYVLPLKIVIKFSLRSFWHTDFIYLSCWHDASYFCLFHTGPSWGCTCLWFHKPLNESDVNINHISGPNSRSVNCRPCSVTTRVCNQEFPGWRRSLEAVDLEQDSFASSLVPPGKLRLRWS
jgi:hypothetical protein